MSTCTQTHASGILCLRVKRRTRPTGLGLRAARVLLFIVPSCVVRAEVMDSRAGRREPRAMARIDGFGRCEAGLWPLSHALKSQVVCCDKR